MVQPAIVTNTTPPQMKKHWLSIVIGILLVIAVLMMGILGVLVFFNNRALPKVAVLHIPVGGKSAAEIQTLVEAEIAQRDRTLVFSHQNISWEWNAEELGYSPETLKTVREAVTIGKDFTEWSHLPTILRASADLPLAYTVSEDDLDAKIAMIADELFKPAIEPEVMVARDGAVLVERGSVGQYVDQTQLRDLIKERLAWMDFSPIEVPVVADDKRIDELSAQETQTRAERLLGKKIILKTPENQLQWDSSVLVNMLSFDNGFDDEKIKAQVAQLALAINRSPENAVFEFDEETRKVKEFKAEKPGLAIQEEALMTELKSSLDNLEQDATSAAELTLAMEESPAKVKVADMNNLGIQELIGTGESFFKGSIPSRVHNIELAASRINGAVIPPGETLSFVGLVGDISRATGFQSAYVIQGGRTVLGDGGGVCQVSSTLFRAALNTGLPIEERKAHSYRVGYYEQQSHPGLDATIYAPSVDLKIKNDTPAHILIQTKLDKSNSHLVFEIYGTSDGRVAEVNNYKLWNQVAPPPPLYQDDPTLAAGVVKQVEHAAWGAKASFDWKVTRGEEVIQEKTFYSVFRAWQAVYLKGPGA